MPKQIVSDVFETLGGAAQAGGHQAVQQVKKSAEDVAKSLGLKPESQLAKEEADKAPAHNEQQLTNIKNAAQKRSTARYQQIQAEIKELQEKRKREIPEQIKGKPGFDEGKLVKQLEEKPASAEATAGKDKLPPLPAQRASKKAEMFRGASG